jgi:osmotically-inducible protein OsmY
MNRKVTTPLHTALFVLLTVFAFSPLTARAQSDALDVTAAFRNAGVKVDNLLVYQISGIVLIRGTTADRFNAEEAHRVAKSLGYARIANLIVVTESCNDKAIVQAAERSLSRNRSLDGCTFRINSLFGIVRIGGSVDQEAQKGIAIELLRRVEGVTNVSSDLIVR